MAFSMKHWIGLTAVGLLLVSIWKLPPSALERVDRRFTLPEVTRAETLEGDVRRTHEALMHLRWSQSLSTVTVETAVNGLAIGFPENTEVASANRHVNISDERKEILRGQVEAELASLQPRADVTFGYHFQLADFGAVEGVRYLVRGTTIYLGEEDGQAYCVRVYADSWLINGDLNRDVMPFTGDKTNAAGACRPYLKYGMPGVYVGEWMVDGASDFALEPAPPADPGFAEYRPIRRTFFGLAHYGFGFRNQSVEVDRCMAGIAEGCMRAVTDWKTVTVGSTRRSREVAPDITRLTGLNSWFSPWGNFDDYLLADLEHEFGPERFQRFWSSELPVSEAFESAFDMGMGEWLVTWVEANMDISPPGPKLSKSAALGGMLALSLFAALAGAWSRRRRLN